MRIKVVLGVFLSILLAQCQPFSPGEPHLVPQPREVINDKGSLLLNEQTTIVVTDKALSPLAQLFALQVKKLAGLELKTSVDLALIGNPNTIALALDENLAGEAYRLEVSESVRVEAAQYHAMARGVATLTQLLSDSAPYVALPYVHIEDDPDYPFRTAMLDLARFWHPVSTIEETLDLLWFYKVPYLHLHLSDNRRFTFPLDRFPDLKTVKEDGSREYYTREELDHLVEYARQRGIAIIPEIDLPGHSGQLWNKYPGVFGSLDPQTKKARPTYVINIAKEEAYQACEYIMNQLAEVFYTSPYLHFGGDEVYLEALKSLPEYQRYCRKHNLKAALGGDANELFCHFINRMNQMVKATGKKSLVWEGFHGTGAGRETISRDIKVIVWNTTYNRPDSLIANGYDIMNATWIPWYMVGAMNLAPAPEKAYRWDVTQWGHWNSEIGGINLESNSGILGGQICYWEQNYFRVIPVFRDRIPVFSERLWSNHLQSGFEDYQKRFAKADALYGKLFYPVIIQADGLLHNEDLTFDKSALITLASSGQGQVRFATSRDWGIPDMPQAEVYSEPFSIDESVIVTAQLFDAQGKPMGYPVQKYFQKIDPIYHYRVLGPAPANGWTRMPDFSQLSVMREGVSGRMTPERLDKINGELFAKVKREGHIEIRFQDLYNPYALELEGHLFCEDAGPYQLRVQTHDGLAELYIDDALVAKGVNFKNEPENFTVDLGKGPHTFRIKYFYKEIQNQLSILYKTSAMPDFEPFENLITPVNQ